MAAGHLVGVGGALHSLQSAHDEHEAGIQQHQPPQPVPEDWHQNVAQQRQLHHTPAQTGRLKYGSPVFGAAACK